MSKQIRVFYLTFSLAVLVLQIFTNASAQDIIATVKVDKRLPQAVEIIGRFSDSGIKKRGRNLSFLLDYAGVQGLGGRISEVKLFGSDGHIVASRRMIDGEYVASDDYSAFSYKASAEPTKTSALAHVSWISDDSGILMFGDLFPQFSSESKVSAKVQFDLPTGWEVQSSEAFSGRNVFETNDIEHAVFFVGADWRNHLVEGIPASVAITGEREFSDDEAAQSVREIYLEYRKIFGGDPAAKMQIAVAPLSENSQTGQWYAETRGTTVTIVSADLPFKMQSMQRLHEQLRHEIFHLWVPSGVDLKGNYDWFYEGFALYESLKTGVRLNRIRFDDFLDTLSRAHRYDGAIPPRESLVEASKNRWSSGNDRVYARGMLVAFLCDMAMLQRSKGKRSVENLFRDLYTVGRSQSALNDANAVVLKLLNSNRELVTIVNKYVSGTQPIDWANELGTAGIVSGASGLAIAAKPNGSQRALLDKLGYNNWRKLNRNSK
jgi:hypothetical protein